MKFSYVFKINRCLTSLLEVNLPSTIKELDDCTHENNGPTKEMLQWAMLSLQRFAALLHILIARCTTAVPNLNDKLSSGHHWNIASIVLGVLGRLWSAISLFSNGSLYNLPQKFN